jgi:hypothetical protein
MASTMSGVLGPAEREAVALLLEAIAAAARDKRFGLGQVFTVLGQIGATAEVAAGDIRAGEPRRAALIAGAARSLGELLDELAARRRPGGGANDGDTDNEPPPGR